MNSSSFVHLHVHSEYSLLDGACRVDELCRTAADEGAPAVALTDHGVMFGAVEFHDAARKVGLTPIIGCEAYIAPRGRFDRTVRNEAHVTLLAADDVGYRNLTALISAGFLEGYYYKPRIDMDLLAKHNDGLIVLSGCMSSLVSAPLLKNDYATSKSQAEVFRQIFGDRFYIEIMRHGMPEEDALNEQLIRLARDLQIPLVATNDSHYLGRADAISHDVLLCIGTGKTVSDQNRLKFATDEFYVKSPREMRELFADVPDACDNTVAIAERISLKIPEKVFYLPDYPVPTTAAADVAGILAGADAARGLDADPDRTVEMSADDYLRLVCERGLIERYGAERATTDTALRERMEYELGVITSMGFSSYFLIVWDFIKYARDRDIPVGPGRGSAVGSVVSYCLGITDLDPLRFGLIFERFLNPERISMPDIDTDFCVERRDEVIRYVQDKYGKDRVAQIVTFGTMAARAAVRDAGRALGVPLPDVDRVAKLIPSGPNGLSIPQALEQIAELRSLADRDPMVAKLLETATSLEGLARNASTHAAGVVISKHPLVEHVPLVKIGDDGINTQYEMGVVERVGLLKMDFLGLRNLTVMKHASDEIRRTVGPDFDLARIPEDDARTFDMLSRGDTLGVFQLESDGMKRVCVELKPSRIEDVIALVALYRPGPMDWIPQYIAIKHGRAKPTYLHPKLVPILEETYSIACLRAGTPVWYADGSMKAIEDVQGGDEILTFDHGIVRPGRAAKAWPSGKKRLLRITLSTGTVIECSEDHRFPTPDGDVFARDLKENPGYKRRNTYAYTEPRSIMFEAWEPPLAQPRPSISIGGEHRAWLLGMLIGDGSLRTNGSMFITTGSRADADAIAGVFQSEFGARTTVYRNTRAWYVRPAFDCTPKPTPLTLWLDAVYGDRSWKVTTKEKHLPACFLNLGYSERAALLRGLWDSDGTYSGTGQYFRSTSPRLIGQVAELLSSLKIAYYVRDTAVHIQDRSRFSFVVGRPMLPDKAYRPAYATNVMAIPTATLGARLAGALSVADPVARQCYRHASRSTLMKVQRETDWTSRVPGFWFAYADTYEELYLGDTRPVFIDRIERIGEDECFDLQMEDQRAPYFIANGIISHNCYQEQVMQIARDMAGFTMGQADELRKVMGKKQKDKIPVYRQKFIDGCVATNGITPKLAEDIFAFIEPFAGYGFNKCAHGSTELQLPDGTRMTLSAAYRNPPSEVMAMWADGQIRPHKVARVVQTGRKPLLHVRTASGKSIKVTAEHRLLTVEGYREVGSMRVGLELITAPRRVNEKQRAARRATMREINRRPEQRARVSARVAAYQAARGPEDKRQHMLRMHERYPDLTRNGVAAMHERVKWLYVNDAEWRARTIAASIASTRACYDTGPGYGRCSIASNGMWCASTPERAMCEWLIEQGITFEMHRVLGNGRICDFYFNGIYWEMDGMDRPPEYFAAKYGDLPFVVVTPERFEATVLRHLGVDHATNGDPIVSIEPCGTAMTYDVEMAPDGPLNYVANRIVSHNSHAAAYGWVSYQTAYLKANYPLQYFAALMSSVRDKTDKLVEYIDEAKKLGLEVLPPDVNVSLADFAVADGRIRFGLAAVKGVGEGAVASILAARDNGAFTDLFDLTGRVDPKSANRKVWESLIKCGALDGLPGNRAQLLDALDLALDAAAAALRERELGQVSLFGGLASEHAPALAPALRPLPAPSTMELLAWEKETLGIFVSGHPLADVADALARTGAVPVRDLRTMEDDSPVRIAGLVTAVRRTMTKAQAQMLFATVEDTTGAVECIVFPKSYGDLGPRFVEDAIVVVNGRLRLRERRGAVPGEEPPLELSVSVNDVQPFDRTAAPAPPPGWHVTVRSREEIDELARLLEEWAGPIPLVVHVGGSAKRSSRGLAAAGAVRAALERIVGPGGVRAAAP